MEGCKYLGIYYSGLNIKHNRTNNIVFYELTEVMNKWNAFVHSIMEY